MTQKNILVPPIYLSSPAAWGWEGSLQGSVPVDSLVLFDSFRFVQVYMPAEYQGFLHCSVDFLYNHW